MREKKDASDDVKCLYTPHQDEPYLTGPKRELGQ